jgi:hypothetical protein
VRGTKSTIFRREASDTPPLSRVFRRQSDVIGDAIRAQIVFSPVGLAGVESNLGQNGVSPMEP